MIIRPALTEAFQVSRKILFEPFSWKKWTKLLFIAWLAGALMGGLNLNGLGRQYGASKGAKTESKSEIKLETQTKPGSGAALAGRIT